MIYQVGILLIFSLVFSLALPAFAQSQACFRFKDTPVSQLPISECAEGLMAFEKQTRTNQLMADYEVFLSEQDKNSKLAWRNFAKKALRKNWSAEDESLMREVNEWAKRQKWKTDPQLERQIQQLESREELRLTRQDTRGSWVERLAQNSGWEDLVILTPVFSSETETQVLADPRPRRWVVYSSVFRPVVFWGEASQLEKALKSASATWVEGTCREPVFQVQTSLPMAFRAWDANACVTANLARGGSMNAGRSLSDELNPTGPGMGANSMNSPKLEKPGSKNWIWWGLLAGAAAAYGLRDKTVVITY